MNVDEVLRWLARADEDLTLVGGQSVALWEHLLGLPVLTETVDIDFLGDPSQAQELAEALGYRCLIPAPDDPTPPTRRSSWTTPIWSSPTSSGWWRD